MVVPKAAEKPMHSNTSGEKLIPAAEFCTELQHHEAGNEVS